MPSIEIDAVDISKKALKVAKRNAKLNNTDINFIQSNIYQNVKGKYDVIISNPPYISYDGLVDANVVKYEPAIALFANDDGLYFYNEIIDKSKAHLKKKGILAFEIGFNQKDKINKLIKNKYKNIKIKNIKDYNNFDRVVIAKTE